MKTHLEMKREGARRQCGKRENVTFFLIFNWRLEREGEQKMGHLYSNNIHSYVDVMEREREAAKVSSSKDGLLPTPYYSCLNYTGKGFTPRFCYKKLLLCCLHPLHSHKHILN
jgi:hypothetical protein